MGTEPGVIGTAAITYYSDNTATINVSSAGVVNVPDLERFGELMGTLARSLGQALVVIKER